MPSTSSGILIKLPKQHSPQFSLIVNYQSARRYLIVNFVSTLQLMRVLFSFLFLLSMNFFPWPPQRTIEKQTKVLQRPGRRVIAAARLLSIPCQSHRADIEAACEYLISECVLWPSELNAYEYWHLLSSLEYGIMLRWAADIEGNSFVFHLPWVPRPRNRRRVTSHYLNLFL